MSWRQLQGTRVAAAQINRSGPVPRKPLQEANQTDALPPAAAAAAAPLAGKHGGRQTPGCRSGGEGANPKPGPQPPPPPPPPPTRGALVGAAKKQAVGAAAAGGAGGHGAGGLAARPAAKLPAPAAAFVPSAESLQELRAGVWASFHCNCHVPQPRHLCCKPLSAFQLAFSKLSELRRLVVAEACNCIWVLKYYIRLFWGTIAKHSLGIHPLPCHCVQEGQMMRSSVAERLHSLLPTHRVVLSGPSAWHKAFL